MNGKIITYQKYKGGGSGTMCFPISIVKSLGWKDKDELILSLEVLKGKIDH